MSKKIGDSSPPGRLIKFPIERRKRTNLSNIGESIPSTPQWLIRHDNGIINKIDPHTLQETRNLQLVSDSRRVQSEMVLVQGGPFQAKGSELRLAANEAIIEPFEISKYPVTVAEFRDFTIGTDYLEQIRNELAIGLIRQLSDITKDNHPAVRVNWADREKYVAWRGEDFYIPSAIELEFVMRGREGREYPYGNTWIKPPYYDNFDEDKLVPVDSFPAGATPEGVCGFGIVNEATSSIYAGMMEIRGGWGFDEKMSRGGSRLFTSPFLREVSLGFRVARRIRK